MPIVPGTDPEDKKHSAESRNQVRVLDAAPPRTSNGPGGGGAMAVAGFGGLMVLALWIFSGGDAATVDSPPTEPGTPVAAEVAAGVAMPDLAGMSLAEAAEALRTRGVDDFEIEWDISWRASNRHEVGSVLLQNPAPGVQIVTPISASVVLSEGGPVVAFADLPADAKAFAANLPGFDVDAPVLASRTPAGVAYKTDGWLFGECAAVNLAYRSFADASYSDDCFERETVTIQGVLIDGTAYQVWGLPPADYEVPAPSGVIVYEGAAGPRALGITTYRDAGVASAESAAVAGDTLVVTAGRWASEVAIYAGIVDELGDAGIAAIGAAIHPTLLDGHLVVGLDSPLRWQLPGELPSRLAANYGAFRVVSGCEANVESVVCDPSGSISVEGLPSGFEVGGLAIRVVSEDVTRRTMVDPVIGLGWELPTSWHVAAERLTAVTFPREIFSAGTFPLRPGGTRCAHMPENALRDLGPTDAFVAVFAGGGPGSPSWPHPLDWSYLDTGFTDAHECADRPDLRAGVGSFDLDTVPLLVVVAMGDDVPVETERELWRLVDSLNITPNIWWTS